MDVPRSEETSKGRWLRRGMGLLSIVLAVGGFYLMVGALFVAAMAGEEAGLFPFVGGACLLGAPLLAARATARTPNRGLVLLGLLGAAMALIFMIPRTFDTGVAGVVGAVALAFFASLTVWPIR